MAGLHTPLLTLRRHPLQASALDSGRRGSLLLHCKDSHLYSFGLPAHSKNQHNGGHAFGQIPLREEETSPAVACIHADRRSEGFPGLSVEALHLHFLKRSEI